MGCDHSKKSEAPIDSGFQDSPSHVNDNTSFSRQKVFNSQKDEDLEDTTGNQHQNTQGKHSLGEVGEKDFSGIDISYERYVTFCL